MLPKRRLSVAVCRQGNDDFILSYFPFFPSFLAEFVHPFPFSRVLHIRAHGVKGEGRSR
jgi:hypothetical protein